MHIYTADDAEFSEFLAVWNTGELIGRYWNDGEVRTVRACKNCVIISAGTSIDKLAVRPTLSLDESIATAKQLLLREMKRGSRVDCV